MGGPPNNWSKNMIDFNLRQLTVDPDTRLSAYGFGLFDQFSIMKYYYPDWMFVSGKNSVCYSPGENHKLSEEDMRRIAKFYPRDNAVAVVQMRQKREAIERILSQIPQSSLLAKELQIKKRRLQQQ